MLKSKRFVNVIAKNPVTKDTLWILVCATNRAMKRVKFAFVTKDFTDNNASVIVIIWTM